MKLLEFDIILYQDNNIIVRILNNQLNSFLSSISLYGIYNNYRIYLEYIKSSPSLTLISNYL